MNTSEFDTNCAMIECVSEFDKDKCHVVTDFQVKQTVKDGYWSRAEEILTLDDEYNDYFSLNIDIY